MTHAKTFTAAFLALSITGYSGAQTVRCTTWNLQWFPSGSAKEASTEQQNQCIKEAADVLRPINPDIVLLPEVRPLSIVAMCVAIQIVCPLESIPDTQPQLIGNQQVLGS